MPPPNWMILGTVGVPGNYGGFETLAENLVRFHESQDLEGQLTVYCSTRAFDTQSPTFLTARLHYINLNANGAQSIVYDIVSLFSAVFRKADVIVLLGVSGALILPLIRLISRARIITNIDGIEWKREKWRGLAKYILRASERAAVRWSHVVIADNEAIAEHVRDRYQTDCQIIAYGGDHALTADPEPTQDLRSLPETYSLALCRIEPENNAAMILEAFALLPEHNLVFVGNWAKSKYGQKLYQRYKSHPNIHLLHPIYDMGQLRWVRDGAEHYIHGHSAGGTNPSLVEMMHFGISVYAYDCTFNRHTTEAAAFYFASPEALAKAIRAQDMEQTKRVGAKMRDIAQRRYTWQNIGHAYFDLIQSK